MFSLLGQAGAKTWCTSNGTFHTEGKGKLEIQFFEYSHSKTVTLQPDIVEYDDDSEKPTFDLIIGVESMKEINIDDDTLPITTSPICHCQGKRLHFNNLASSLKH